MDALPLIAILTIIFSFAMISEIIRLKKELRKISRLIRHMRQDIEKLKVEAIEK